MARSRWLSGRETTKLRQEHNCRVLNRYISSVENSASSGRKRKIVLGGSQETKRRDSRPDMGTGNVDIRAAIRHDNELLIMCRASSRWSIQRDRDSNSWCSSGQLKASTKMQPASRASSGLPRHLVQLEELDLIEPGLLCGDSRDMPRP
jgi:hypothetical protein